MKAIPLILAGSEQLARECEPRHFRYAPLGPLGIIGAVTASSPRRAAGPPSLVLGINAAYHESAAAIVRDGVVVMSVEEERLSRRKHAKDARVDNADQLPWRAIELCLAAASASLGDVDRIAYSLQPGVRTAMAGVDPYALEDSDGWGSEVGERAFDERVRAVPSLLAARADDPAVTERVRFVPHHRAHAALAYRAGPFDAAAVLVLDGIGELATGWLGRARDGRLERIEDIAYPHSLGMLWEQMSTYLGFGTYEAGTVMGLAAYGDPDRFSEAMTRLLRVPCPSGGTLASDTPPFLVDPMLARFRGGLAGLVSLFGPARRAHESPVTVGRFADVAAALQHQTERALLATARRLAQGGATRLVYAGGVALNCVANARLERDGPFAELFIPGPAHDGGTALGAALELAGVAPGASEYCGPMSAVLLGPAYDTRAIDEALGDAQLTARHVAGPASVAAERIAAGELVGWFQGRAELGPRALGNRSLLADPRSVRSREALNARVKQRESFRPFAASCLAAEASAWFHMPDDRPGAQASRGSMLLAYPVRAERAEQIPAVVHVDGTCRIQTVHRAQQPLYHRLIERFAALTNVPMVLNTSFNQSEPIVCSPRDAIDSFRRAGLDALIMGDRLVTARR